MSAYEERLKKLREKYGEKEGVDTSSAPKSTAGEQSAYSERKNALLEKYKPKVNVDNTFINTFIQGANSFLSSADSDYKNVGWGNASTTYEAKYNAWKDLDSRYRTVRNWLYYNKSSIDADTYKNLSDILEGFGSSAPSVLKAFEDARDFYSQWDSEEAYNVAIKQAEADANRWAELTGGYDPSKNQAEGKAGWDAYVAQQEMYAQKTAAAESAPKEKTFWDYLAMMGEGRDTTLPFHTDTNAIAESYQNQDLKMKHPDNRWTDEQRETFGYLWNTERQKAYEYAFAVNNMLNTQAEKAKVEKIQAAATDNFWAGAGNTIGAIAAAPLGMADYLSDLIAYGAVGYVPQADGEITPFEYSQAVTSGVSEHLNKYGTLDENIPVVGGKGWGDVYGLGTSIAQSSAAAYTGGSAQALITFFGSAAASGVDDAINRGATGEQAMLYGTAVGAAEALAEMIGIDNLMKIGSSSTLKELLVNLLKQSGAEGLEEGITNFLGNVADNAIMGDKSNFYLRVEEYRYAGLSEEEAKKKAWGEMWGDMAYDMLGGFVSGGVHAGPQTAYHTFMQNNYAQKTYGSSQKELVGEALEIDPGNTFAQKMQGRLDSGKNLSGSQLNRLVQQNETALTAQDMASIQSAAETRLQEMGETGDVTAIAAALAKQAAGEKLSRAERQAISSSKYGQRVANELNTENIKSGEYSSAWAENIGTERINAEEYSRLVEASQLPQESAETTGGQVAALTSKTAQVPQVAPAEASAATVLETRTVEQQTENKYEVSDDGKTYDNNNKEIVITGVESVNDGKMILKTETGTIDSSDVQYATGAEAIVYESVANMGATPASAWAMINGFKESDGVSAQDYATLIPIAYKYGKLNYRKGLRSLELTPEQRDTAFRMGREDAAASVKSHAQTSTESTLNKKSADKKIIFEGFTYNEESASDVQKASIAAIDMVNKMSSLEIHVYKSVKKNGKLYAVVNGKERLAPNGYFTDGNKIYIDINAGNKGEGLMLYTLSHEIGHYIARWNAQDFKAISDFLFEHYGENVPIYDLLDDQKKKLRRSYETDGKPIPSEDIFEKEAQEELVCDMLSRMMADKNAYDKLMELKQKDLNVFQKLGQAIKKVLDKIAKLLGVYDIKNPDFMYAASVENFGDEAFRQLQDLYMRAFVQADANYQAEAEQKNTTEDGGASMSIREIVGESGTNYGKGVYLDSNKLSNIPDAQRKAVVIGLFRQLGGKKVVAYDQNGTAIEISIADSSRRYKNSRGKSIPVNNHITSFLDNTVKQEALILADEVIAASRFEGKEDAVHAHDWLDNDGKNQWDVWKVFLQEKNNSVWEATLKVANTTDGERILYELYPIEKVEAAWKPGTSTTNNRVTQLDGIVKNESAEAVDVEVDTKTESVSPAILKSERTWTESDYVQEREQAAKDIAKAIGVSVKKAKAYIDSVNSIAKMIADDRVRLDYFSSPNRSSFVSNVEYGGSFDFSTLCKKRRLLTGTFTAIQKALPNTALTADEILDIRNRMKDAGLEVSCGLCYVEGSRANMGQFAKEFLRLYKQYYPDAWQPNMADVNTPDGIEWVRINHPEVYEQYEYFWNHYGTLKPGDKNLFASQQKPKLYQLHTEYKGEILEKFNDDDNVDEKNLNGGIRLQSFSDFEIVHLIDTMQIIMDMSRVGLAGQAYTKVPDFAWALGDTGLKINLSLIAKGVDENGKLIFDDVEGMPIDTAVALRDRYSKNVGTILVAFNDEQLMAAMADERVDYIIPFHRSQWKKSQYGAMGLPAKTKDYTYMQNEKFIKPQYHEYRGRMVKDKATNYMPNEYWDFTKSGKENAEAYLEMCARNNKRPKFYKFLQNNGDGSYSLKADGSTDGYWKLLIDFKMYDNDGNGSPQMPVKPDFNMDEATRMLNEYSGGHSNFPVAQGVVDDFVNEYKDSHRGVQYSERDNVPTFYSQMAKVVDGVKQEKLGAASVVSMLRGNGVKAEEIKWSGIETWLEGKKSVTKAELQEFIAGSMLQIVEEQSDTSSVALRFEGNGTYKLYDANGNALDTFIYSELMDGYISEKTDEIYSYTYEIEDAVREEYGNQSLPRWAHYKLYGGSNYREIVFRLPNNSYSNQAMRAHWGDDAEGVLAHARIQDFNVNGKKMLFVEELQSDYHNEGHESGYADSKTEEKIEELKAIAEEKFFALEDYSTEMTGVAGEWEAAEKTVKGARLLLEYREAQDTYDQAMNEFVKKIPDAPFKDTYHEYVLKRLLRMAAEEGYDSIGWTPSEIQEKRWSEDFAEGYRIEYDQDIPKFLSKIGKKWGTTVGKTVLDSGTEVWSMAITDSMKDAVLTEGQPLYQNRTEDSVSNRSLLANALEGVAQNEIEKQKIQEYRGKIDLINAEEEKLSELNEQIKELSFAKGPRDTKKIRVLQFEARQTANRISTYDKQLLRLEASKPLQDVLTREKKMAYQRAEKKGKEALAAYREKATKTQRDLLEKWQESRKKGIDSRHRTVMRHKIKDIVNELNQYLLRGTKDRHVPIDLQKAVAEALDAVNMDTVGAEERIAKLQAEMMKAKTPEQIQEISRKIDRIQEMGDRMNGRLQKLKDAYDQFVNSDDPLIANSHDDVISNKLQSVIEEIGDTPLRDMTLTQLEDVYDMYRMVLTTIRNANKAFKGKKSESISVIANQVMMEVEKVGGKKKQSLAMLNGVKSFGWNNLKPVYAFEHIGSNHFTEVFNNVRAGEDVWAVDVTEAREFYLDKAKKHNYDSWDFKKRYKFTSTSGMEFSLDLEQIMSLYAYSKRDQAADHLKKGGIVFDESTKIIKKTKMGISLEFNPTEATAYNISEETLADIVSKLTDEQKGFVDEMQDYLSTVMGAKGNEVSLEMYGVKLFKEKFYFPLKSAHQFMAKAKEQQKGEVKIKNSGFSKETVQKASNPIVLTPFMNVWSDHVNEMSMYHAFVLPLEDFYRVYNYKTPTSETMATESVEMFIQNAYGKGATGYIDQLLKDLNGGARTDSTTGIINKMVGLFKKGAVFASLSVVVQQPSAIARAAALVDTRYFIGPKVDHKRHKALWDEVKQYAPVAIIKEMGYFDTNMGKSTQDFILGKEYSSFSEKMKALVTDSNYRDEVLSKAPALADEVAWCGIWEAVKRETKAKNPGIDVKSDDFLKKVGERFTEVIVKTQVYDSVLSRSGMMRSKDTGMKMATSFMAEPTTSINMIADALLQGKRGNRKYARTAIGAVIASQILNSILVSFVYAGRDDDEDETYLEKYIGTFTGEVLDSLNPAGYIPFIKDIMSIVQGYDVERSDMAVVSDLWNAWQNLSKDNVSVYRKVEGFAGSIAQIFGLPVKNIMRDARGIYQTIDSFVNGQQTTAAGIGYAVEGAITGKSASDQQQLYEAYLSGDAAQIARVKGRFKDQNAINNAIRKALRENDPRINEAAIAWNANDLDEYMRIAREIIAEKHFTQDDVVMAIRSEASALAPDDGTSSTSKAKGLFTVEKFAEAISQGDHATANAIKADIIQTAQKNGKTQEEAEKSFISSAKSELRGLFVAGSISDGQVTNALKTYCQGEDDPMDEDDIYWLIKGWEYEKETGTSEGYGKYNDFHAAVETGMNLKEVIKEYIDHGVEQKTLASQITSHFKPLYKEMSNTERATVKGHLLNAYAALGYNRYEKAKDIDKWLED